MQTLIVESREPVMTLEIAGKLVELRRIEPEREAEPRPAVIPLPPPIREARMRRWEMRYRRFRRWLASEDAALDVADWVAGYGVLIMFGWVLGLIVWAVLR